jgi:hypothetical protein
MNLGGKEMFGDKKREKSLLSCVGRLLLWIVFSYVVLLGFLSEIFRLQVRSVADATRASNKHILNPAMMTLSGYRYWYAATIRDRRRRTGKEYATTVVAEPTDDGFIIPLPYGERVDRFKNVLAAERATVEATARCTVASSFPALLP